MFELMFKGNLIMLGAMFIATKKKKKNLLQGFNTTSEIKLKHDHPKMVILITFHTVRFHH